jgi:hypothetical protein
MTVWNPNGTSTITIDNGAGTPKALTAYVREVSGLEKMIDHLEKTALADTEESTTAGIQEALTLVVSGDFDDATDGPEDVFGSIDDAQRANPDFTATVTVVLDGTNRISFEAVLEGHTGPLGNRQLVQYQATLKSDGTVTIDTV